MTRVTALLSLLLGVAFFHPAKAAAQSGITDQSRNGVTCASDDGRRHYCSVNTNGGVRMVNQRSGSPCVQGQTWGYDRRGIWVDRGCRADFALNNSGNRPGNGFPGNGFPGNGFPGNGYPGNGNPGQGGNLITCSSNDGRRNYCNATTGRGVTLVTQRSGSPCVQNQTWGYSRNRIWVDRGCRADFQVGR